MKFLWDMVESDELRQAPLLVAGLGLARAAWWARSSDQEAWEKQQESSKK